ncbi:MAG: hypothetical protein KGM43_04895 [Planctomycetota bacterium]|nr:hypothetical protein [Planctomycetota bacterium]
MQTLPLAEQFPYGFQSPGHNQLLIALGRRFVDSVMRDKHKSRKSTPRVWNASNLC